MTDLAGKVALVTGGSRGIGAAIARRLARDGAAVAFTYVAAIGKAQVVSRHAGGEVVAVDLSGRSEVIARVASLPLCTALAPGSGEDSSKTPGPAFTSPCGGWPGGHWARTGWPGAGAATEPLPERPPRPRPWGPAGTPRNSGRHARIAARTLGPGRRKTKPVVGYRRARFCVGPCGVLSCS